MTQPASDLKRCPRGHEQTEANVYRWWSKTECRQKQKCRLCREIGNRRFDVKRILAKANR